VLEGGLRRPREVPRHTECERVQTQRSPSRRRAARRQPLDRRAQRWRAHGHRSDRMASTSSSQRRARAAHSV
jgi:hypothetical protein